MKNNKISYALICIISLLTFSCSFFELDTVEEPAETLKGSIVDLDGNPVQVEYGNGARIVLYDFGSHDNPEPQYLKVKGDGTFENTKVFESTYKIVAEGPFIPLEDDEVYNDFHINGTDEISFTVEPFLTLDWIGDVVANEEGSFTVKFSLERGTENTEYHKALKDVRLFISTTQFVGDGDKDNNASPIVSGNNATNMIGKENTMTTKLFTANPLEKGRPYYLRVGARLSYGGPWGSGNYCYTTVQKVVLPL